VAKKSVSITCRNERLASRGLALVYTKIAPTEIKFEGIQPHINSGLVDLISYLIYSIELAIA